MVAQLLVVVDDLYFKSIPVSPHETYSVLGVHSNAVLSGAVSVQRLQLISWRHSQVVERDRGIQDRGPLRQGGLLPSAL